MLAVPGAFTPTCSMKHLPGFVEKFDEIKAKGVDTIACVGVNDAFVMDAWGKSIDVGDKILLLADGSAIFTKVCCACQLPSAESMASMALTQDPFCTPAFTTH